THDRWALARMLASSDVFVHAGDQETFGLAVLEAMACGLPVVGRDRAGLRHLIDAQIGQAVSSDQASDFAQAIAETAMRTGSELQQEARARALRYSWPHVFPGLFAKYDLLLQGRRNRAWMAHNRLPSTKST